MSLKNLSDATLASLRILKYPRLCPTWRPIIFEKKMCDMEKVSQTIFFLGLFAMMLESN